MPQMAPMSWILMSCLFNILLLMLLMIFYPSSSNKPQTMNKNTMNKHKMQW